MALDPRFRRYLEHFGRTVPVRELVTHRERTALTALRHDVDYDIDVAMDAAYWEQTLGARASYYILHDAPYASDARLLEKCLQIQDYGHEVGLHLNLLSAWYRGAIDDIAGELAGILERWRGAGLGITGVAAHGDRLCYEAGFANYWLFSELCPESPAESETGITAEGTRASTTDRSIAYPSEGHALRRADGKSFDLWSLRLADFGLDYEASRVPADHYYSDSGGSWKRSPDPIGEAFDGGRRLVLMHPIHWRHAQRHFYFLSTARSGSKWLATFLDAATSLTARHEFTLNHRLGEAGPVAEKRTGAGFTGLVDRKDEAAALIAESRSWSESLTGDFAEANVYLERFLDLLPADDASIHIHLHRDPFAVVRSLVGRGWYDVPFDDRHPAVDLPGWAEMRQSEQAAWYVRDVNERLSKHCRHSLSFERMVADLDYLCAFLLDLGIPVHRRLASTVFGEVVNATKAWSVPPVEDWPVEDKAALARVLGPIAGGAPEALSRVARLLGRVTGRTPVTTRQARFSGRSAEQTPPALLADQDRLRRPGAAATSNADLTLSDGRIEFGFAAERAGYVLLGGGRWHGAKEIPEGYLARLSAKTSAHALPVPRRSSTTALVAQRPGWSALGLAHKSLAAVSSAWIMPASSPQPSCPALLVRPAWGGFAADPSYVHTLRLGLRFASADGALRVLLLSHDRAGVLIAQKDLGLLSPAWPRLSAHFRPDRRAASFNLALYHGKNADALAVEVDELLLAATPETALAGRSPDEILAALPARVEIGPGLDDQLIPDVGTFQWVLSQRNPATIRRGNVEAANATDGLRINLVRADRAGHLLLAPGLWQTAATGPVGGNSPAATWRIVPGAFVSGRIRVVGVSEQHPAGLHLLSYDGKGMLSEKLQMARIRNGDRAIGFRMPLLPDLTSFNVALLLPAGSPELRVADLQLALD